MAPSGDVKGFSAGLGGVQWQTPCELHGDAAC